MRRFFDQLYCFFSTVNVLTSTRESPHGLSKSKPSVPSSSHCLLLFLHLLCLHLASPASHANVNLAVQVTTESYSDRPVLVVFTFSIAVSTVNFIASAAARDRKQYIPVFKPFLIFTTIILVRSSYTQGSDAIISKTFLLA